MTLPNSHEIRRINPKNHKYVVPETLAKENKTCATGSKMALSPGNMAAGRVKRFVVRSLVIK